MFTLKNTTAVHLLTGSFKHKPRFKLGSPFAKFTASTIDGFTDVAGLLSSFEKDVTHEQYMGMLERELTALLQARIKFISNDVVALVDEVFNAVEDAVNDTQPKADPVNIVQTMMPSILDSELLDGLLTNYRNHTFAKDTIVTGDFPVLELNDIRSLLNVFEGEAFSQQLTEVLACVQPYLVDIYDVNFRKTVSRGSLPYPSPTELMAPAYVQFVHLERIVVLLLTMGFLAKEHDGVNLSLAIYHDKLTTLKANTAKQLIGSVEIIKASRNNPMRPMVKRVLYKGNNSKTIVVESDLYDKFLDQPDATPQTVVGLSLLDKLNSVTAARMDGLIEAANRAASNDQMVRMAELKSNRRSRALSQILIELKSEVESEDFKTDEVITKAEMITRIYKAADNVESYSNEDLYFIVRKIICCGIYPKSGAEAWFKSMDRIQRSNPSLPPRQVATLAMVDMLSEYLADQFA